MLSRCPFPAFLIVFGCLTSVALAQSSTRSDYMPSVSPAASQPNYAPVQQEYTPVQQGTPIQTVPGYGVPQGVIVDPVPYANGVPMQGSQTRSSSGQFRTTRPMNSAAPAATGSAVSVTKTKETFDSKLWNYLVRSKYRNWSPVPGQSDAAYEGQSPHGAYLKMYLNRRAAGDTEALRSGSIIIKENFSASRSLAAVTVMYKTNGYNPKAGDWYWVKYNPDGSVASKSTDAGDVMLSGRVNGCINCHGDADGGDFVFFND